MILTRVIAVCMLATLICATPVRADVLEIGHLGEARWVSGPQANAAESRASASTGTALPDVSGMVGFVPEQVMASPATRIGSIPERYAPVVAQLAARYDLSPALIEALVWQESRWRESAVSPAGARGLAQLMPGTARELGVNPHDPVANLEGGARYLRQQLDRFGGNVELALAAYNAGPGRVMRAGGIPPIAETQDYVARIMGRLSIHSRSVP